MARILTIIIGLLALAGPAAALGRGAALPAGPTVEDAPPFLLPVDPPHRRPISPTDPGGLVSATGVVCAVDAVRPVDVGAIPRAKEGRLVGWEIACAKRFGFILVGSANGRLTRPQAYPCLSLLASEATAMQLGFKCELKENLDPIPAAQALADAAGARCTVSAVKWRGWTPSKALDVYELACAPGQQGWFLQVPRSLQPLTAQTCLQAAGAVCRMTPREQALAWIARPAAKAGRPCEVFDADYLGRSLQDGSDYYEVVCKGGDGFVLSVTQDGEFKSWMSCEAAAGLASGCTRSDPEIVFPGLIAKLRATGLACGVVHARLVGLTGDGRKVAEFECTGRPQGLIVAFPEAPGGPVDSVDCLDARHFATTCRFVSLEAQRALLTRALASGGVGCAVFDFRKLGDVPGRAQVFEVACGGAPGMIVELPADYSRAIRHRTCAEAARDWAATGMACTLPANRPPPRPAG